MGSFSCDECLAIYVELRESSAAARELRSNQNATPRELAAWLQQLHEDDCARLRETSSLWKTWRRLQEHRALTGHWLSLLPSPPEAMANPN